jgi:hypothetical protein
VAQWVRKLDYLTTHTSLSPILHGFAPGLCKLQKGCTRLAAANAKAYQFDVCVYAGDASTTVDLHESDKRNALLGPLLIDN